MKTAFAFVVLIVILAAAPCRAADMASSPQVAAAPAVTQSIPANVLAGSSDEFIAWLQHKSEPASPTSTALDFAKLQATGCSNCTLDCCCITHPPRCFCC